MNWKVNIAIAIFSIIISAYSVEYVLFYMENSKYLKMEIDEESRIELLEHMRAQGIDAWPLVKPGMFVKSNGIPSEKNSLFPLSGISNKPCIVCNENGQYTIFESDEHGFNNPKGLYKKSKIKVALVGDSFTLGYCVMSGEDIASQLQDKGIITLNFGNGNNGPLIELATLKEYIEPLQPEIVLWIYYEGNDLDDLKREKDASMLLRYLEDDRYSQNLLNRQDEIDAILTKYVEPLLIKQLLKKKMEDKSDIQVLQAIKKKAKDDRRKIIKLWHIRKRLRTIKVNNQIQKPMSKIKTYDQMLLSLFSEILATAYKQSSDWGGTFYFVYLPSMRRYMNDTYDGGSWNRDDVLTIVHKLGIPLIDIHEEMKKHPEPLSLIPYVDGHYNARGYKFISELIVSKLKKDGLISKGDIKFVE